MAKIEPNPYSVLINVSDEDIAFELEWDMTDKEEWRPVVGFEKRYEVSNCGRVRSLDHQFYYDQPLRNGEVRNIRRARKGQMLRPGRLQSGHLVVVLSPGYRMRTVHSMVLNAFVGPPPPRHESLHNNDISWDNRLENLLWGTRSQNSQDSVRNGRHSSSEQNTRHKISADDVRSIRKLLGIDSAANVARQFGLGYATVMHIKHGRIKSNIV